MKKASKAVCMHLIIHWVSIIFIGLHNLQITLVCIVDTDAWPEFLAAKFGHLPG